jgi:penicillin-insensitive murein endopeptidase
MPQVERMERPGAHRRRGVVAAFAVVLAAAWGAEPSEWGRVLAPTAAAPEVFGEHARGCLAGAVALPATGPHYQVMRPSRNRAFGHPLLIAFVQTLGVQASGEIGWSGLLVGDLAQPRGGPMASGHRSHQSGLDVDIWFEEAPPKPLTRDERETRPAPSMVAADGRGVDPSRWRAEHGHLLRLAAGDPQVDRIFVNAAIKRTLCETVDGDRTWLHRIRPWWGHDAHFHVRLACPATDRACTGQDPLPPGEGCDGGLDWWFSAEAREALERSREQPPRPITLDELPTACRGILDGS